MPWPKLVGRCFIVIALQLGASSKVSRSCCGIFIVITDLSLSLWGWGVAARLYCGHFQRDRSLWHLKKTKQICIRSIAIVIYIEAWQLSACFDHVSIEKNKIYKFGLSCHDLYFVRIILPITLETYCDKRKWYLECNIDPRVLDGMLLLILYKHQIKSTEKSYGTAMKC